MVKIVSKTQKQDNGNVRSNESDHKFREAKLEEIYKKIQEVSHSDIRIQAVMGKKNPDKQFIYWSRILNISGTLGEEMKKTILNYITESKEAKLGEFDLSNSQSKEYLIETLPDEKVANLRLIMDEMDRNDNEPILLNELKRSSFLMGLAIRIGNDIIAFVKVTRNKLLIPKKYLHVISTRESDFTTIQEQNIIAFPESIDAILYEDPFFIFNRNNFISLFRFDEIYSSMITKSMADIENIIDDPSAFMESVYDNRSFIKRLASASAKNLNIIIQNKNRLPVVSQKYKLNIKFSKSGEIDIHNSNLTDILTLLNRQTVIDELGGERSIAHELVKV